MNVVRGERYSSGFFVAVMCIVLVNRKIKKKKKGCNYCSFFSFFFLVACPVSEALPRLIRTRPASRTWLWWVSLPTGVSAYTRTRTRDLLKRIRAAYHSDQPLLVHTTKISHLPPTYLLVVPKIRVANCYYLWQLQVASLWNAFACGKRSTPWQDIRS